LSNFVVNPYRFVTGGSYTSQCPRTGHGDMYGTPQVRNGVGARLYKTDTTFPYVGNNSDLYSVSAYFKVNTSATIDRFLHYISSR